MPAYKISNAAITDIPQLLTLVNSGYRGEVSKKGWTSEADLLDGSLRIDAQGLLQMIKKNGAIIKKCVDEDGEIVGCVYLEKQGGDLYLGMLTISPEMQAHGLGKKMLAATEVYAAEEKMESIVMVVISLRQELINWYIRHGYFLTGDTKPFPKDNKFGTPTKPLEFSVLKKNINQ